MKLLHFSDTHLGFSEYFKIDPDSGLNQREQDFYNAWHQVIDAIVAHRPDVVVHAGDLFHTPRPSNRAIRTALESIQKISDAGIPFIIVAGNHETPRIRTTGSIFESLALFPNVYAAYSGACERFRINDVDFYCIPHCSLTEEMDKAFATLKGTAKSQAKVFVSHGAWGGEYGMGEFNEQRLPDVEQLTRVHFDYIALGHYHRYVTVKENACYSGSTERTSLNEHNSTCGYLLVDLDSGERIYHDIATRPMIKLSIDCTDLTPRTIYDKVEEVATPAVREAIVQLVLKNIVDEAFLQLDVREIDAMFADAFYLDKQFLRITTEANRFLSHTKIESLPIEFERFLAALENKELDKQKLVQLGAHYLESD
ncbi:exonuclease SbcCD subunit D [candidate division KSB1 bacterium]|nr:exonuclease SbcCD subunit D [candidate division KSB1 bacterium]RQW01647.1 MAG: exonuclease SbcCD subunit D [candidate division KSB1 bacterium]